MLDLKTRLYYGSWMFFGIFLFIQKLYNPSFYTSLWWLIQRIFYSLTQALFRTLIVVGLCLILYLLFQLMSFIVRYIKWLKAKKQQAIEDRKQAEIELQYLAELKRKKLKKAKKKLKRNKIYAEQIQKEKEQRLLRQHQTSKSIHDEAINDFL